MMLPDEELLAEERESYSFLLSDAGAHAELPDLEQCAREDEEVRRRMAHVLTLREQQVSDDEPDLEQSMANWRMERERRVQQMLEAAAAEAGERSAEEDLQADLFAMTALGLSSVGGDTGTADELAGEGVVGRMPGEAAEPLSMDALAAEVETSASRQAAVQERLQRDDLRAELAASEAARRAMLADLMGCAASASVVELAAAPPPPSAAAAMPADNDAERGRGARGAEVDERRGRRSCQQRPLLSQAGAAGASGRVQAPAQAAALRGSDDACRWARGALAGAAAAPAAARAGSAGHSRAPLLQRLADGAGGAVAPAAGSGNVRGASASRGRPPNGPGLGLPLPKCVSLASTSQLLSQASERDLAGRKMAADLISTRKVRPPSPAQRAISR